MSEHAYTVVRPGQREIDWPTQGDLLVAYLREAMPVRITLSGWCLPGLESDDPMMSNGYRLYAEEFSSQLIFASLVNGIQVFIETESDPSSEADLEPWRSAFVAAYERIFDEEPEYAWWAALTPTQGEVAELLKLAEGGKIGDVSLEPAIDPYTEAISGVISPNLGGASLISSYPVVARGRSRGYNLGVALHRATIELNTVCALMSLSFGSYWKVCKPPVEDRGHEIALPVWGFGLPIDSVSGPIGMVNEVSIPGWMGRARQVVDENDVLYSALHSHREGLVLMAEHPSVALICFVGAIEGIGSMLVDLQRCDSCQSRIGAGKRFRKALKTVFTNKQVDALLNAYEFRSQTAHVGVLHGEETSMGNPIVPFDIFAGRSQGMNFRYENLWAMRDASKEVILKQFSE